MQSAALGRPSSSIKTTDRFATLDALRGVAAIMVVFMHSWLVDNPNHGVTGNLPHGSLAVDMFFILSGFVISYRYPPSAQSRMTAGDFLRGRIERLYPLFLVGYALGALPFVWNVLKGKATAGLLWQLAFNFLSLPSFTPRVNPSLLPIISPAWSLFSEFYVANLLYALLWMRLNTRVLIALVALGAAGLIATEVGYGTLDVGPLWSGWTGAFTRVLFSFFAGVMVQRLHSAGGAARFRGTPAWIVLLVCAISFAVPVSGVAGQLYEISCVFILYPLLMLAGANAKERQPRLGKMVGNISYALYIIHIPIMLIIHREMINHHIAPSWAIGSLFIGGSLIAAWTLARIDVAFRSWLKARRRRMAASTKPAATDLSSQTSTR